MNEKEVRRYLNVIKRAVALIESQLDHDDGGLLEQMAQEQPPAVPVVAHQPAPPLPVPHAQQVAEQPRPEPVQHLSPEEIARQHAARKKHIGDLLAIDCWPEAMPTFMARKEPSEQDQLNRANAVLDFMIDRSLDKLSFLDYGCGDGWITRQVLKRGVSESTGYDLAQSEKWKEHSGVLLTTNRGELKHRHYDVVMLYDVLDHTEDPVGLMQHVKSLIKPDGSLYIRCHPWTSKHASHLFKQNLNLAYIHLFLKYEELAETIGSKPMFTREERDPIKAYHWWFSDFEIKKERFVKEPVSEFFHVPAFKDLLANEQGIPAEHIDGFLKLMEIQFVDYVLVPKR